MFRGGGVCIGVQVVVVVEMVETVVERSRELGGTEPEKESGDGLLVANLKLDVEEALVLGGAGVAEKVGLRDCGGSVSGEGLWDSRSSMRGLGSAGGASVSRMGICVVSPEMGCA